MPATRPTLNDIYFPIESDLAGFNRSLKETLLSNDGLISQIHEHLLKMTGKFLRPALVLLTSKAEGNASGKSELVTKLAVAVELIHTATLVHDDIIDDSETRRNQPSVYFKWGREISIVSGDYLYAKAFLILAGMRDLWVNEAFAACAHVMCEGEMKQIEKRNNFFLSDDDYFKIIHKKTAALFQAACMGGGYFAGASADIIHKLGEYGFNLGMAFQIVDDCLDIVGDSDSLGKTVGLDILKNDITLPVLYLFRNFNEAERARALEDFKNSDPGLIARIKQLAVERGAVDKAMAKAREYADRCAESLKPLKASVYKDSLLQLVDHCVDRVR